MDVFLSNYIFIGALSLSTEQFDKFKNMKFCRCALVHPELSGRRPLSSRPIAIPIFSNYCGAYPLRWIDIHH